MPRLCPVDRSFRELDIQLSDRTGDWVSRYNQCPRQCADGVLISIWQNEYRRDKPLFPGHCVWRAVPKSEGRAVCRRNSRHLIFFCSEAHNPVLGDLANLVL
jgi:hypothetical protein